MNATHRKLDSFGSIRLWIPGRPERCTHPLTIDYSVWRMEVWESTLSTLHSAHLRMRETHLMMEFLFKL